MFTLSYYEDLQDSREIVHGLAPRVRTIRLMARLDKPRNKLTGETRDEAWEAFQQFTKPGQTDKYFDLDYLKEVLGEDFDFSVTFRVMTARTAGPRRAKSAPGSDKERMIGFLADIKVESKGDKDATDLNIAPLLDAIAAAADRQAHDTDLGHLISIGETVPMIGAHRPRPLPPGSKLRRRQPR